MTAFKLLVIMYNYDVFPISNATQSVRCSFFYLFLYADIFSMLIDK